MSITTLEVRVPNLDGEECASKVKKALLKLKGVHEVEVDMGMQKITVMGVALEEKKVFKSIKRAGKAAEPWQPVINHDCETLTDVDAPAVYSDEAVDYFFSDENPHACSTM